MCENYEIDEIVLCNLPCKEIFLKYISLQQTSQEKELNLLNEKRRAHCNVGKA